MSEEQQGSGQSTKPGVHPPDAAKSEARAAGPEGEGSPRVRERDSTPEIDESTLDAQTQKALAFVRTVVAKMQMNVEVNLAPDDGEGSPDEIRIEVEGPDAGRIIGKKGNVLDALQYLTARVVVRPGEPRRHIIVDAEGYRARHEDQLAQMARRLAQRVAAEGKVITFDPMSARERRIVHMALRDIKGVRTESMGEEPQRRVQIIPEKTARQAP
ncbi:MAG: R3H domain-containing nucleic acid-binding protein [Polyangiaceae bacterium]